MKRSHVLAWEVGVFGYLTATIFMSCGPRQSDNMIGQLYSHMDSPYILIIKPPPQDGDNKDSTNSQDQTMAISGAKDKALVLEKYKKLFPGALENGRGISITDPEAKGLAFIETLEDQNIDLKNIQERVQQAKDQGRNVELVWIGHGSPDGTLNISSRYPGEKTPIHTADVLDLLGPEDRAYMRQCFGGEVPGDMNDFNTNVLFASHGTTAKGGDQFFQTIFEERLKNKESSILDERNALRKRQMHHIESEAFTQTALDKIKKKYQDSMTACAPGIPCPEGDFGVDEFFEDDIRQTVIGVTNNPNIPKQLQKEEVDRLLQEKYGVKLSAEEVDEKKLELELNAIYGTIDETGPQLSTMLSPNRIGYCAKLADFGFDCNKPEEVEAYQKKVAEWNPTMPTPEYKEHVTRLSEVTDLFGQISSDPEADFKQLFIDREGVPTTPGSSMETMRELNTLRKMAEQAGVQTITGVEKDEYGNPEKYPDDSYVFSRKEPAQVIKELSNQWGIDETDPKWREEFLDRYQQEKSFSKDDLQRYQYMREEGICENKVQCQDKELDMLAEDFITPPLEANAPSSAMQPSQEISETQMDPLSQLDPAGQGPSQFPPITEEDALIEEPLQTLVPITQERTPETELPQEAEPFQETEPTHVPEFSDLTEEQVDPEFLSTE